MKSTLMLALVATSIQANDIGTMLSNIKDPQTRANVGSVIGNLGNIVIGSNSRPKVIDDTDLSLGECMQEVANKSGSGLVYAASLSSFVPVRGQAVDFYSYDDARSQGILKSGDDSFGLLLKRGIKDTSRIRFNSLSGELPAHARSECSQYFYLGQIDLVKNGDVNCRRVEFFIEGVDNKTKEELREDYHVLFCEDSTKVMIDYQDTNFNVIEVIQESEESHP